MKLHRILLSLLGILLACTAMVGADEMAQVEMLRQVFARPQSEWRDILSDHSRVLDGSFFTNVEKRVRWAVDHNHIDDAIRFTMVGDVAADVKGRPGNYRLGLAEAFIRAGNVSIGSQLVDNILLSDKDNKPANFMKGGLLESEKNFFEAHKRYKTLSDGGYQRAECLYRMGRISLLLGEDVRARKEFEQCLQADSSHQLARRELDAMLNQYRPSGGGDQSPPTPDQKQRAVAFFEDAEGALQASDLKRAESMYLKATEADPLHVKAHVYLGALYYRLGNIDLAVEYSRKATELDPADFEAWRYLGNAYERRFDTKGESEDLTDAVKAYQRGIELNPDDQQIQGELDRAQQKLEPAAQNG